MDITQHPGFAETYVGIRRSFGQGWAGRFTLAAPLMFGDPTSALYRAFLEGLEAHSVADAEAEDRAWATCLTLLEEVASSLVTEAESFLREPLP